METLLRNRVGSALDHNPYRIGEALRYETDAGRVILRGFVPSWFHKQMAQEALRSVEGIAEIQNELRVIPRRNGGAASRRQ